MKIQKEFYNPIWAALSEFQLYNFDDSKKEQVLLNIGDEITIDSETNKIYRNGQLFLENLSLDSKFFTLLGDEIITFSNLPESIEWKLFYKPRFN
jgi:phage-related protein